MPPGALNVKKPKRYDGDVTWGFLGSLSFKKNQRREVCWKHLKAIFKDRLQSYSAWNVRQWKDFDHDNLAFFNFHQYCNSSLPRERQALETLRMAELVSSGFFVASEAVNHLDAKSYEGIVFVEEHPG